MSGLIIGLILAAYILIEIGLCYRYGYIYTITYMLFSALLYILSGIAKFFWQLELFKALTG